MTRKESQKRLLIILSAVLLLLAVAVTLLLILRDDPVNPAEEPKQILVIDRDPNHVMEISYTYQGKTVCLKQNNGLWSLIDESDPDAANFPLNTNFIYSTSDRSMTAKCAKLVLEKKVLDSCTDKAAYGLDHPTLTLTYELLATPESPETETATVKVYFGKQYATSQNYCMIEVGDIVDPALYLIDSAYFETFAHMKEELANRDSLPQVEAELIVSYQLGDTLITNKEQVAEIFEKLKELDFADFAKYKATAQDFVDCGVNWQEQTEPKQYPEQLLTIVHYASKADMEKEDDPETEDKDESVTPYTFYLGIGKTEGGKTYYRTYGGTAIYEIDESFFSDLADLFQTVQNG